MSSASGTALLDGVQVPEDLRRLPESSLVSLADEVREFLVRSVAASGGHLAAGLGTVELTVALHYVFDTPHDALVWDVGHQCYPHKILTGRRQRLATIRRRGGLSGFLRRDESPYDTIGAGHSSTSISAALGIAVASARQAVSRKTVAIIGDGGLTAGLAYEALHHAGGLGADLLVVLNDNGMSISPNVGAIPELLARLGEGRATNPGQFFRDLGFEYLSPCDGHDLPALLTALRQARDTIGPRLLHVRTQKGHGYAPAERDPVKYHGVTPFDPPVGIAGVGGRGLPTYTDVFGQWLCDIAREDPRVVAITPAMREGSGLVRFAAEFPDRYFDVGIAEQHSVTFAAGLASQGLRPVVAIYSTFCQRAYDQLLHDVALQRLPVVFAIDRAGLVGPDGATHNGSFDLSYLRCVPGMTVMTPSDGAELRDMLYTALLQDGPVAIRYPRTTIAAPMPERPMQALPVGAAQLCRRGSGTALLAFGTLLAQAQAVGEIVDATVVNMRCVKPLDERMLVDLACQHDLIVTLEENATIGGAGSAVNELLSARGFRSAVLNLGLPDCFLEHGTRDEVLRDAGLDRDSILSSIAERRRLDTAIGRTPVNPARKRGGTGLKIAALTASNQSQR